MTPVRIHLTGASGSGTTTLGAALAQRLACAHHDTDSFFWLPTDPPFLDARPVAARLAMLETALGASDGWVDPDPENASGQNESFPACLLTP